MPVFPCRRRPGTVPDATCLGLQPWDGVGPVTVARSRLLAPFLTALVGGAKASGLNTAASPRLDVYTDTNSQHPYLELFLTAGHKTQAAVSCPHMVAVAARRA